MFDLLELAGVIGELLLRVLLRLLQLAERGNLLADLRERVGLFLAGLADGRERGLERVDFLAQAVESRGLRGSGRVLRDLELLERDRVLLEFLVERGEARIQGEVVGDTGADHREGDEEQRPAGGFGHGRVLGWV